MTGGGPANATQITSTYTLQQAYSTLDFGYAGALSVVLLIVMLAFTWAYLRITKGIEDPE
jgi:multiple sugar transport system permease protein